MREIFDAEEMVFGFIVISHVCAKSLASSSFLHHWKYYSY